MIDMLPQILNGMDGYGTHGDSSLQMVLLFKFYRPVFLLTQYGANKKNSIGEPLFLHFAIPDLQYEKPLIFSTKGFSENWGEHEL